MTKFWLIFPYNLHWWFLHNFFNLQLLHFGYMRFFFLFHKQWIGYWLLTTWQNWFKSLPLSCVISHKWFSFLMLWNIESSFVVHVHQTHQYILWIILIDCVVFMWEWNKCVSQSHLCINIRKKKSFDGLIFIYQLLTPTLLMLDIYTSWLVNFYLCCFFQLFCTNLSMHQLLFSLCCENFF